MMQVANQLVGLAFFLALFVPCAWVACQLTVAVMRDVRDFKKLCGPSHKPPSRRVCIDRER